MGLAAGVRSKSVSQGGEDQEIGKRKVSQPIGMVKVFHTIGIRYNYFHKCMDQVMKAGNRKGGCMPVMPLHQWDSTFGEQRSANAFAGKGNRCLPVISNPTWKYQGARRLPTRAPRPGIS